MKEFKGLYYGADMTSSGGSISGKLAFDNLGGIHSRISVIDSEGHIVQNDGKFLTIDILDAGVGVNILRQGEADQSLTSGSTEVSLGEYTININPNNRRGVIFNGHTPETISKELNDIRYSIPAKPTTPVR